MAGDTNGLEDIFVRDRVTGTTTRVSVATGGTQATGGGVNGSFDPTISPDGRYVAFDSFATNLVAGDTNSQRDVFVHDRVTGVTTRVSVATGGTQGTGGGSYQVVLNGDARYVAFASDATDLVAGDTNGQTDAFVHDRTSGLTTRVSVATGGNPRHGHGYSWRESDAERRRALRRLPVLCHQPRDRRHKRPTRCHSSTIARRI